MTAGHKREFVFFFFFFFFLFFLASYISGTNWYAKKALKVIVGLCVQKRVKELLEAIGLG